jgi:hypothetical protein
MDATRLRATAALAIVTFASACGGGGGSNAGKSSVSTTRQAASPADQTTANDAVPKPSDFPAGWTAKSRPRGAAPDAVTRNLALCLHIDLSSLFKGGAHATSAAFTSPTQEFVLNSVRVGASVDEARRVLAVLSQSNAPNCLAKGFDKLIRTYQGEDVRFGAARISRLSFPPLGDRTVALRVTLPVEQNRSIVSVYADLILTQKARWIEYFEAVNAATPSNLEMNQQLIRKTLARLPVA